VTITNGIGETSSIVGFGEAKNRVNISDPFDLGSDPDVLSMGAYLAALVPSAGSVSYFITLRQTTPGPLPADVTVTVDLWVNSGANDLFTSTGGTTVTFDAGSINGAVEQAASPLPFAVVAGGRVLLVMTASAAGSANINPFSWFASVTAVVTP